MSTESENRSDNKEKQFKILSIDGGGVRGILPARLLCEMEDELRRKGVTEPLYKYFDLICGTSTGGIIAIGLSLGMSAQEILNLYTKNASRIFGGRPTWLKSLSRPKYSNQFLDNLLKESFKRFTPNGDTRLGHAKTRLCIPVYNAENGKALIYKTAHEECLIRDYQIPASDIAMSTAAAPTIFSPYSFTYTNVGSANSVTVNKNIDGGVIANNPTLIGLTEAHNALKIPYENIKILSLGTGHSEFHDKQHRNGFGLIYWATKARLIDLMFSAQSQTTDNLIKFINNGIGEGQKSKFYYKRVQHIFEKEESIPLDTIDIRKLQRLEEIAVNCYKEHGAAIYKEFLEETTIQFKPLKQI